MNKKIIQILKVIIICTILTGCTDNRNNNLQDQSQSANGTGIQLVGNYNTTEQLLYNDEGTIETVIEEYRSEDELCVIREYPSYFEVELNYEKGNSYEVGRSYADAIHKVLPEYEHTMEPYLFENIRLAFQNNNYSTQAILDRINTLLDSLDENYCQEIIGFAEAMSNGTTGIEEDGIISYEEAILMQMIPDALRPNACSALSLWGSKTVSGDAITLRCLEWTTGSENQLGMINCVTRFNNGTGSFTSIGMLGIMNVISAINNEGVFAAILDVGAIESHPYICQDKQCYTWALRWALEHRDTAKEVGNYMVENSGNFTFCHNLIITDPSESYCAEDCVKEVVDAGEGFSVLRSETTPLLEGLRWENEDSLCVVNSFATKGNQDSFTGSESNLVRFAKYNNWVKEKEQFSLADIKNMITQECVNQNDVAVVHSSSTVQLILVDYHTQTIQVAFSGTGGAEDKPDFVAIGTYQKPVTKK